MNSSIKSTLCKKAMKLPRQTECGYLFCKDCLEPLFTSINPLYLIDKERISREELMAMHRMGYVACCYTRQNS